jgi:hypothetical protein
MYFILKLKRLIKQAEISEIPIKAISVWQLFLIKGKIVYKKVK